MRWFTFSVAALCVGSVTLAQVVFTPNDLDKAMKGIGRNIGLANAAIVSKDTETVKERVARARELLTPTVSFWNNEKRPDARQMVRTATERLDDLDALFSTSSVDWSQVAAAAAKVDQACQACHAVYREEGAATGTFKLKGAPTS